MPQDDSMGPVTDDLVARLERELAEARATNEQLRGETYLASAEAAEFHRDNAVTMWDAERKAHLASKAEVERLKSLVETAFRDGLSYGTDVVVTDPDEAWRTSRVRAALTRQGETG